MHSDTHRWLQLKGDPVTFGKDAFLEQAFLEQVCNLGGQDRPKNKSPHTERWTNEEGERGS